MTLTRAQFLDAYRAQLHSLYPWAQDAAKLDKFMSSCAATLAGASTWNHDGEAVTAVWKAAGGKGKPSLKALRGLA